MTFWNTDPRDHGARIKDCILHAVIGKQLGRGCYRTVYALDEHRVLKVEADGNQFSNAHEWAIWQDVQGTKWERWFAPCIEIDSFGIALIQARTKPLTEAQWNRVKELPDFFADLKSENFGTLKGRMVCHDYGNHKFLSNGLRRAKLVAKAKP